MVRHDHATEVRGPHIPTFRVEMTPRQVVGLKTPWVVRATLGESVVVLTRLGVIGTDEVHVRIDGGRSYRLTKLIPRGLARLVRDDGTVLNGDIGQWWKRLAGMSRRGVVPFILPDEVAVMLALNALGLEGMLNAWGV